MGQFDILSVAVTTAQKSCIDEAIKRESQLCYVSFGEIVTVRSGFPVFTDVFHSM